MAKTPGEVGKDFDEYAREWEAQAYRMEAGWDSSGVQRSPRRADLPGDEWGEVGNLIVLYEQLFPRIIEPEGPLSVLEIGAGGGRSTQAVVETLGDRIDEYHVIDVSDAFLDVLRQRIERPIDLHVVTDVDLSAIPRHSIDLCLAQSSWSHINLYDQFRYLRDLRGVLKHRAPVVVNGQFLLGLANDWAWNRFRRRVYQVDHAMDGVYHEVTGVGVIVEQLLRLEYEIEVVHDAGFVARRIQANPEANLEHLQQVIEFPYVPTLPGYASGEEPRLVTLTRGVPSVD